MAQWQNDDGLTVRFGQDQARETQSLMAKTVQSGPKEYMVVDINFDDLPTYTTDLNNDGTNNGFSDQDAYIPAGSYITKATLIVETLFAGGTSYNIGLYNQAGSVIDADGIDAAVALTVIDGANDVVVCNGDLVAGILSISADAYLVVAATGTFTAGKAKLVIEYIPVTV
jgi:hypothetical protein